MSENADWYDDEIIGELASLRAIIEDQRDALAASQAETERWKKDWMEDKERTDLRARVAQLEAADSFECRELEAQNAALRAEVERLNTELNHEQMDSMTGRQMVAELRERVDTDLCAEIVALRAEVEQAEIQREYDNEQMDRYEARIAKLEDALRRITDYYGEDRHVCDSIARAALAGDKG
jgi:chromosome segregation ATPase